jgi:signal recognition particle subunit SRP54
MFDSLTDKFQNLFSKFSKSKISEDNIKEAIKEVRLSLLDADVNYSVASLFVQRVKEKAIGENVVKSISPKDKFIKIVHQELISLMGSDESALKLDQKLSIIMLIGLQGSGKTTNAAKLANYLKKKNKKVLLAACDLQRAAAITQLKTLAAEINIDVFSIDDENDPRKVAKKSLEKAKDENYDVLIVDTAGRLHIDTPLMNELKDIKKIINPIETLFVASASLGQDAVNIAKEFDEKINITGSILTMLDSDARAGAAISITEITKKPLKFEGTGEKINDLQVFSPKSMADRILGMGDIINLVRKAEDIVSEEEKEKLENKLRKQNFNYEDYLKQMSMIKKMGSMKSILKMIPGMKGLSDLDLPEKEMKKTESIIKSMTKKERHQLVDLTQTRRRRLASGSGTSINDVNKLVKGFMMIKKLLKNMPKNGMMKNMLNMNQSNFGGKKWL